MPRARKNKPPLTAAATKRLVARLRAPHGVLAEETQCHLIIEHTAQQCSRYLPQVKDDLEMVLLGVQAVCQQRDVLPANLATACTRIELMVNLLTEAVLLRGVRALSPSGTGLSSEQQRALLMRNPGFVFLAPTLFTDKTLTRELDQTHPELANTLRMIYQLYNDPVEQYQASATWWQQQQQAPTRTSAMLPEGNLSPDTL